MISDPQYQHLLEKMWGSTTRRTPPPPRPAPVGRGGSPAIPKPHCTFTPSKVKAIQDNVAPPTLNLENPSDGCDIDLVPLQAKERRITAALSNSFGFGGTNASLIFTQPS